MFEIFDSTFYPKYLHLKDIMPYLITVYSTNQKWIDPIKYIFISGKITLLKITF